MRKRFAFLWMFILLAVALIGGTYGCSADRHGRTFGDGGSSGDGGGATTMGTQSGGVGGCLFNCGGGGNTGVGGNAQGLITIQPTNVTLDIVDGAIKTQGFTATYNNQDVTGQVLWVYERPDIGDIDKAGLFTPTGAAAGQSKLVAQLQGAQGETVITVTVKKNVNSGGLTPAQVGQLDNPAGGADPSVNIVYPFNETVFPLGVLAPEIQWNGGQGGEVYKLQLKEKYYEYNEYFSAPPPSRHITSEADWASLGSSGGGAQSDPVSVSLTRLLNGQAFKPVTQTWHIGQGKLKGSIYYWELPDACGSVNGRVLRIKPDSPNVDEFYNSNGACFGCHTVSRDGKSMMATFDQGVPFPMQTIDLSQNPAKLGSIVNGMGVNGTFAAFNDKGDKLIFSNDGAGAQLKIVDTSNGGVLNPNVIPGNCGEPAWSPDGKKIAAICDLTSNNWIFDSFGGNLAIGDVDANGFTVSNVQTIVQQNGGQGRPAYPSFSPGSEWLAFGRPTSGSRSTGNGNLWLVAPDGSGLKELKAASSENNSYNPVFAPLRAGGYFWLVYISRRDYGNKLVGVGRQQLWITAISDPPSAGDPSNPPFYVRGQEDCGKSENAYYALDPCIPKGMGVCTSGVDCCGGNCVKDPATNKYICGDPPKPGECSQDGNACETTADCCDKSAKCQDGFCTPPVPQ